MAKNKKIIFLFLLVAITIGAVWFFFFYQKNLRGVGPAIIPPKDDITKLINTTGMPLKLPEGFAISIFAKDLGSPRVMAYDPYGNLLVSIPSEGKVVALGFKENGTAKDPVTVAEGLNYPHGLAFRCTDNCKLYIAESDQVATYDYSTDLKAINKQKIIDLPDGGNHKSRTIMFMPSPNENKLLISVGSSCNVCNENDDRRAKILIANYDGADLKTFAKGLRNSVFMAIHPVDGKIWATDMGRDLLGDNIPPDEINIIEKNNSSTNSEPRNYGWPICYGKNIHDNNFDKNIYIRNPCMEPFETPSHIDIPAHSAPLGLAFVPEEGWPEDYWYNALVAYHGSWNRSVPTGYKIVRYKLDAKGKYLGEEDFITGWLQNDSALGRPVDILIQPGGTILISDDKAGVIYKVTRK
ncbi:MAG: PQQ-dependent sugar dehydrogenase [Candidatus Paceibacterota bacterium]|jgi:glucose/arabinose dehydrogenase